MELIMKLIDYFKNSQNESGGNCQEGKVQSRTHTSALQFDEQPHLVWGALYNSEPTEQEGKVYGKRDKTSWAHSKDQILRNCQFI